MTAGDDGVVAVTAVDLGEGSIALEPVAAAHAADHDAAGEGGAEPAEDGIDAVAAEDFDAIEAGDIEGSGEMLVSADAVDHLDLVAGQFQDDVAAFRAGADLQDRQSVAIDHLGIGSTEVERPGGGELGKDRLLDILESREWRDESAPEEGVRKVGQIGIEEDGGLRVSELEEERLGLGLEVDGLEADDIDAEKNGDVPLIDRG